MPQTSDKTNERLEQLERAINALENSEDFSAWLTLRGQFRDYSSFNTFLIWLQCPNATLVAGYKKWQSEFNRQVKKGEKGIQIYAPRSFKKKSEKPDDERAVDEIRLYFRAVYVFDVSQTEGDPLPAPPACQEITGDSLAAYFPKLVTYCQSLGYSLSDLAPQADALGSCNYATREIRVDRSSSPNEQVCVFIHELVHALGAAPAKFGKRGAETIAESAAYLVACRLGLDTEPSSAPYVAAFSSFELRREAVSWIEHFASSIEHALGLTETVAPAPEQLQALAA